MTGVPKDLQEWVDRGEDFLTEEEQQKIVDAMFLGGADVNEGTVHAVLSIFKFIRVDQMVLDLILKGYIGIATAEDGDITLAISEEGKKLIEVLNPWIVTG